MKWNVSTFNIVGWKKCGTAVSSSAHLIICSGFDCFSLGFLSSSYVHICMHLATYRRLHSRQCCKLTKFYHFWNLLTAISSQFCIDFASTWATLSPCRWHKGLLFVLRWSHSPMAPCWKWFSHKGDFSKITVNFMMFCVWKWKSLGCKGHLDGPRTYVAFPVWLFSRCLTLTSPSDECFIQ